MTQCERLIEKGVFPKSFFEPEIRDGFLVDTKRKKIWAVEIDLLLELDRICKKHNLRYFLMYGSLLGAIRHKGFIPWDDDLDVAMPREDYEKLIKIAPKEMTSPYFFQIPETDNGYYYTFAKIRNSNTAAIIPLFKEQGFNMGILLDIFPLDLCDLNTVEENFKMIQKLTRYNTTFMRMKSPNLSDEDRKRVEDYPGGDPYERYEEIQRIAQMANIQKHEKCINAVFTGYSYDKQMYNCSDFEETVYMEFEKFLFPVPIGYKNILETTYGNYMCFPPVEKRGVWHSDYIIDPDISYKELV